MDYAAFQEFNHRGMNRRPEEASRLFRFQETIMNDLWRNNRYEEFVWPEGDHGNERLPGRRYGRLAKELMEKGIKARANVRISNYNPSEPFLMIEVRRLNIPGNPQWLTAAPPGSEYHVSVGKMNAIMRGVPNWRDRVEELYRKFDNANLWLWPRRISPGHSLELNTNRDPIASDPTFLELQAVGDIRWNLVTDQNRVPILDAYGQLQYQPNIPQPHVSM